MDLTYFIIRVSNITSLYFNSILLINYHCSIKQEQQKPISSWMIQVLQIFSGVHMKV